MLHLRLFHPSTSPTLNAQPSTLKAETKGRESEAEGERWWRGRGGRVVEVQKGAGWWRVGGTRFGRGFPGSALQDL